MVQATASPTSETEFRNVSEAIRVLRSGRKDERWYAAAEFLISRATPEVTLMLDVGRELGRRNEEQKAQTRKKGIPWRWILIAIGGSVTIVTCGYMLARVLGGICA